MNINTVIPFCTYDKKFIQHTIDAVKDISTKVIVVYSDKLFDGSEEDLLYISHLQRSNEDCLFVCNRFHENKDSRWNHNQSRWSGFSCTNSDYVFFIDSDEVFDKNRLKCFLENGKAKEDIIYFANYWYFRDTRFQAKKYEQSPLLIKSNIVKKEWMFTEYERHFFNFLSNYSKSNMTMGEDGLPLCHHYSWALDKEEMLRKVKSWGHNKDRDWESLIHKEFEHDFNGTDFVHGYFYNILDKGFI